MSTVKINKDWHWMVEDDRYVYKENVMSVAREVVEQNLKHLRTPTQSSLLDELYRILAEWQVAQKRG